MIDVNWPMLTGGATVAAGGIWGLLLWAVKVWQWWQSQRTETPGKPDSPANPDSLPARGADEPPPSGAVEWVTDIITAMGAAPPDLKLQALLSGVSRDAAKSMRIADLESRSVTP